MPEWLTKAKKVFQHSEPKPAEKYRLQCRCGEIVVGSRGEREQRALCPTCGLEMFVLPESVYPPPRVRRSKPPALETVSLPATGDSPPSDQQTVEEEVARKSDQLVSTKQPSISPAVSKQAVVVDHARGIRDMRPQRFNVFTPFRVTVGGILVVLAVTGFVVIRERNIAKAQTILTTAAKAGRQAVEEGDLSDALIHFTAVDRALETLGGDYENARELRQLFREVRAAENLLSAPLNEMISSAADAVSPDAWQNTFELTYKAKWIVLETTLSGETDDGEVRIDFPVTVEGDEVVILLPGSTVSPLGLGDGPRQVILAGRLESCQPTGEEPRVWKIRCNPESAFLWSTRRTYELMGFLPDEEVVATLEAQSNVTEAAP